MKRRWVSLQLNLLIAICACLIVMPSPCLASPDTQKKERPHAGVSDGDGAAPTLYLCQLLRDADTYKGKSVRVLAFYAVGYHESYLYVPACEQNKSNTESSSGTEGAEVHYGKNVEAHTRPEVWATLRSIHSDHTQRGVMRRGSRIRVTVVGTLDKRPCEGCRGRHWYRFVVDKVEGVWVEPMHNNSIHPTLR